MKGPELLNKYVGETEHKIREVFKKAREKASEDVPVVIFFDEMDSLFRMRGSGISSDMEATVVAQFLSEIDGVESLRERDRDRRQQPPGSDRSRRAAAGPPRPEDQGEPSRRGVGAARSSPST